MSRTTDKIEKVDDIVTRILTTHVETKDNDKLLILKVWADKNPSLRGEAFLFRTFALEFLKDGFPDPATITRSRRKLQQKHFYLRGHSWEARHNEADKTKGDI
tara:strand:- start:797 stop:1105 length:309 start_codon:yes stop_codon:yes gene_type:complete